MRRASAIGLTTLLALAVGSPAAAQPVLTDSLYNAHHPSLLFSAADVATLAAKVKDGGRDDEAYEYLHNYVHGIYLGLAPGALMGPFYGLEAVPALGVVAHLASPPDPAVMAKGKLVTTFIAETYEPDFDEAASGMRLRSLALGYDLFFADATEGERAVVRDEIVRYIERMIWTTPYQLFEYRPYLGNHSAMFGAALGLAGIGLYHEADPARVSGAIAMADRIVANLLQHQFDPAGAYNEGGLYALWTLRQLVYYFDARQRFDGYDYGSNPTVRAVEQWLPYELLPQGGALSHNLNDSPLFTAPFARNTTYFDWAMREWNSGLSSWMWEHTVGDYGVEMGMGTDKVGTALWHEEVPPLQPDAALPRHRVWLQRGLYHVRTGWQTGANSIDDVVFCFYSGKFQGGHAQEDQNQFALYGYGASLVIDHGAGGVGKESEAHNMVFVDGLGQHNAGASIGTDGRIAEYLLGGSADYIVGDATDAYGTHSEFNAPGVPFPGIDWSWGYSGANPVQFAHRRVLAVHGGTTSPYFVVMDDIDKDGLSHAYDWRLHTHASNLVDLSAQPWRILAATAALDIHVLHPSTGAVTATTSGFENLNPDPNSILLRVGHTAVNPRFSFLLIPRRNTTPAPPVARVEYPWGYACSIDWGDGVVDYVIRNDSGATALHETIATDALVAWVREVDGDVDSYLAANASSLVVGAIDYVTISDGTATCEMSGATIQLDRDDADFRFFDSGIAKMCYRERALPFVVEDGYLVPSATTAIAEVPSPRWTLSAHPNPFNPTTMIRIDGVGRERMRVAVYDVTGRRVRQLWDATVPAGSATITWDGRDDAGRPVASGTYFVRASTRGSTRTTKLTLVK